MSDTSLIDATGAAMPEELQGIHACVDVHVPTAQLGETITAAIAERSDNLVLPGSRAADNDDEDDGRPGDISAGVVTLKRWKPKRVLHVRFLDTPSDFVRERIEHFATQWHNVVSVRFVFDDSPNAEIRITCTPNLGSWSYLGTDALTISRSAPTMNYGWFDDSTEDEEFARTTLHEFGHALAAIHEHSSPVAAIPWDRERVYRFYERTQGWSRPEIDAQVFARYSKRSVTNSRYDPKSIMHYPIPAQLLLDPSKAVGLNTQLSAEDKKFMARMYP